MHTAECAGGAEEPAIPDAPVCKKCKKPKEGDDHKWCSVCREKARAEYYRRIASPEAKNAEVLAVKADARNKLYRERKASGHCVLCGGRYSPFGMTLCIDCAIRQKETYEKNVGSGLCTKCGEPAVDGFTQCKICQEKNSRKHRDKYQKLKDEVFEAYGGYECVGCGNKDPECLQLDHINDDGAEHRKTAGSGSRLMDDLKKKGFPPIVQVLCANCNWKKKVAFEEKQRQQKAGVT
jgi:hypothetical protein